VIATYLGTRTFERFISVGLRRCPGARGAISLGTTSSANDIDGLDVIGVGQGDFTRVVSLVVAQDFNMVAEPSGIAIFDAPVQVVRRVAMRKQAAFQVAFSDLPATL
jgi:hypothetical protein